MKKFIAKARITVTASLAILLNTSIIKADGFDSDAAYELVMSYLSPMSTFLLMLVPTIAVVVIAITWVTWMMKDEDEREHSPFTKKVKKVVISCIVVESITLILKIFGIV